MGFLFVVNLEGKIYSCKHCQTHLAVSDDIVSKAFHCRHGKAYLFSKVVNVFSGSNEERMILKGCTLSRTYSASSVAQSWGGNMRPPMRTARSTKRGSSSLRGLRYRDLMGPTTGSALKLRLVEAMPMMPDLLLSFRASHIVCCL
ncbi:hypothetical protein QJS04_geneDACA007538 [Acorus gramineus]|uniref:Yippee domain-containing protein n=1 Tax=Acorus gramineus TaxID=55184 RepID=A0AAV9B449_ACOGR|nr:hypothetical protein QJS04_geneDACA007538 [Acorus gramineus]